MCGRVPSVLPTGIVMATLRLNKSYALYIGKIKSPPIFWKGSNRTPKRATRYGHQT
eukprot:SAG11_NODE_2245_length_3641_cov_2.290514_3_plen_56_part_00